MVIVRNITIPRIFKKWRNSHDILDIKGGNIQGKEEQCWVARNSRYNTKHEQVCVGGKAIKWLMITQIIEARMVFLIMNPIDISEEFKVLKVI